MSDHNCDFCEWTRKITFDVDVESKVVVSVNWELIYNYFKKYPDAKLINFRHDMAALLELENQNLIRVFGATTK